MKTLSAQPLFHLLLLCVFLTQQLVAEPVLCQHHEPQPKSEAVVSSDCHSTEDRAAQENSEPIELCCGTADCAQQTPQSLTADVKHAHYVDGTESPSVLDPKHYLSPDLTQPSPPPIA